MKAKRHKSRGFACVLVLVFGGAAFLMMSAVVNLHLRAHKANQQRHLALQTQVNAQAPLLLTDY